MENLIRKLRKHNISVNVAADQLELNIPDGFDSRDIINEVRENKEELIAFIKKVRGNSQFKRIEPSPEKEFYVLSSAQKRLYFLHQFDNKSLAYHMPKISYLDGKLDREKLSIALNDLIARHESLRTIFQIEDDEPVQKILDNVKLELEYYQASEKEVPGIIKKFIRPFDLGKAPLLRAGIIERSGDSTDGQDEQVLMIDMHHIIGDGISMDILVNDFMALYSGRKLPALRLQYKDYAEWQQGEHQNEIVNRKTFWLNEFKEEAPVLDLPFDYDRPAVKSYGGGQYRFQLEEEETKKLRQIAEKEGATMFMLMLSLYNVFLAKVSDQEDIVVGTSTVGRQHADLENILGVFINTVPLRNYPKGNISFKEFLSEVKHKSLSCFDNQAYPYEALIEDLKLERDISRNPLFDVFFQYDYQGVTKAEGEVSKMASKRMGTGDLISKFDITLRANETNGNIYCVMEYAIGLFREETVNRFINYFKRIVSVVLDNPEIKLSEIEILSEEEKQQLVKAFNDTESELPAEATIVSLFDKQVDLTPDDVALVVAEKEITYKKLQEQANSIAFYLNNELAVKPGDLVGLLLERDSYLIPSIFGVLKAGAAYVPIDPGYPVERIDYVVKDSAMKVILTTSSLNTIGSRIEEDIKMVDVSSIDASFVNEWSSLQPAASDLAYMIYTSGSSGQPKGVMIEHGNVVNFMHGVKSRIDFNESTILCLTTMSFDIFVLETILPLTSGMKVVLASDQDQRDPNALTRLIKEENVDIMQITPSQLKLLLMSDHHEEILRKLTTLMIGGEALPKELLQQLRDKFTGKVYNMYGPTEATVWSTIQDMTYSDVINIGKPISNTSIRILNSHHKLVPVGINGELCIGGKGVSRGYWNNEQLTKEKFITDPVNEDAIIYKTGDLARWLPDGNILILGRIDDQVKIRGHRIELGEIEFQLASYDKIKESAVSVIEKDGNKILAAYYVAEDELQTADVRSFLLNKLPEYMVPSYFVSLDSLPRTPNGKTDRKALKNIELTAGEDYVAPSGEIEEKLVEIWADVLKLRKEQVSVVQSFFELGGHSLNAVTIVNKMYAAFDIEFSLRELFLRPNIKAIAEYVETCLWLDQDQPNEQGSKTTEVII